MGQPRRGLFPMTDDERRLLELLAASDDGCTDAILLAHGIALERIDDIVSAGLARAQADRRICHRTAGRVLPVRITEIGRQKLAERR
jgi:hypothetical protein